MHTEHSDRTGHPSVALAEVAKGLLFVTLVICAVGVAAIGIMRLSVWAAPAPAMAAPSQPKIILPPAPPLVTPVEPTPVPLAAAPDTHPPSEPVGDTVVDPIDTSEPEASPVVEYTVVAGDTLGAIAAAHGLTVADLVAANDLADPDLLFVGQTLYISASGDPRRPVTSTTEAQGPNDAATPSEEENVDPATEDRWIDVDLSDQSLTAYEGNVAVFTTLVSTGLPQTPTPVGQFRIWIKLRYDDMAGPGYYIEDVPFVMYFHEGYGLHGVTWHGNFGHPMSHGCVNLPTSSAEWLFGWADVGTLVNIRA